MKPPRIYQLPTVTQQIKSSIAAVTVPCGGWTVYGYCRDQNLQPIAGYSVFFVNNQKVWIEAYGYAITSELGFFEIGYSPPVPAPPVFVYLGIVNNMKEPIYLDSSPFEVYAGKAIFRDCLLYTSDAADE